MTTPRRPGTERRRLADKDLTTARVSLDQMLRYIQRETQGRPTPRRTIAEHLRVWADELDPRLVS